MPRWIDEQDREEDEDDRWQAQEDQDADLPEGVSDPDEEEPTVTCPHCHRDMLEDSPYCPYCETYVSQEDSPPLPKPWWIVLGVILCLFVVYLWIVAG